MTPPTQPLDPHSTEYTEALLQHMSGRLEILSRLRDLGRQQSATATTANADATLNILARKQTLLDELRALHSRLGPYQADDPEARVWTSEQRREQCRQLADESRRILQEVISLEQTTIDEFSNCRDAIAAQLQDGTDSVLAHSAYTAGNSLSDGELDLSDL